MLENTLESQALCERPQNKKSFEQRSKNDRKASLLMFQVLDLQTIGTEGAKALMLPEGFSPELAPRLTPTWPPAVVFLMEARCGPDALAEAGGRAGRRAAFQAPLPPRPQAEGPSTGIKVWLHLEFDVLYSTICFHVFEYSPGNRISFLI